MSLALVYSRALSGMNAPLVEVEAHLANGLPHFNIVGLLFDFGNSFFRSGFGRFQSRFFRLLSGFEFGQTGFQFGQFGTGFNQNLLCCLTK